MSNGIETAPATGDKRRKRAHRDGHCTTTPPKMAVGVCGCVVHLFLFPKMRHIMGR